jgi:hypothetical protein
MVLKNAFCSSLHRVLALVGPAAAEEYRPGEFLNLDLSKAALSPKRLGPETQFAPVPVEAKDGAQADADASVWPKPSARKVHVGKTHVAKTHVEKTRAEPPRAEHTNTHTKPTRRQLIRWTRRQPTRGSRPGRAGPAPSATGGDKAVKARVIRLSQNLRT